MEKFKRTILLILTVLTIGIGSARAMDPELAYLAATLFGEAGGEGILGIQTVASVIVNRRNYYQGRSKGGAIKLSDVCLAKYQFSFWNAKHNWTTNDIERWASKFTGANARAWKNCLEIAQQAIAGTMKDVTNGATFYYATWMDKKGVTPSWGRTSNVRIVGNHKLVYGVGLAPLKTWGSAKSIAGGGGGSPSSASPYTDFQGYPDECKNAPEKNSSIVSNEIMKHRLFAEDILINMQDMMLKIYKSLSVLFARGHALMCFSTKVSPLCLDAAGGNIFGAIKSLVSCTIKVPMLNYFIPGLLIYIAGFFMCMSIGMYFIDISFKLGFAVLFLPLTLALWPFPPTQSKFTENVASILNSAMLFAFAAVGTAYAVILVDASLGANTDFWRVMELTNTTASGNSDGLFAVGERWFNIATDSSNSMEKFSEAYSISSTNILIILFALCFGFKILASSINNYLGTFFGDGMLGAADSTMHQMGTQAVGFIKNHTVDPAARYARDVAMFQGGKAIEGAGNMLAKIRPNSKFGSQAANPTTNGNTPPTPGKPNPNAPTQNADDAMDNSQTQSANDSVNDVADDTQATPDNFADNSADSQNTNSNDTGSGQPTGNTSGKTQDYIASRQKKPTTTLKDVRDRRAREQRRNASQAKNATQQSQNANGANNQTATQQLQNANGANNQTATQQSQNANGANNGNGQKQTTQNTNSANNSSGVNKQTSTQQAQPQSMMQKINEFTRPTGHSLTVGNAFKAVAHPQQAYRTVKQLAQQGVQDWQNADSLKDKGKLVMKKSGQVVMRSVRGNATEAASATIGVTSGFLQSIGRKMQQKPAKWQKERQKRGSGPSAEEIARQEQEEEAQYQREQDEINNSYNS